MKSFSHIVEPKPDPIFKMLGKHEDLFKHVDVDDLSRLPSGWKHLIKDLADNIGFHIKMEKVENFHFVSVKEWNGELLIEQQHADQLISDLIKITQEVSRKVCQSCGETGQEQKIFGKQKILCEKHRLEKVALGIDED